MRKLMTAALMLACTTCAAADDQTTHPWAGTDRHVIVFAWHKLVTFTPEQIVGLNESGLTGVGLTYVGGYDFRRGPTVAELEERLAFFKQNCKKDIWPTVYLNQMLGFDPRKSHSNAARRKGTKRMIPFTKFRGLDFDNSGGGREIFEANWFEALRIARALGSPGIMFDPEFYNDNRAEFIVGPNEDEGLVEMRGLTPAQLRQEGLALGAKLADLAHEAYPGAAIWSFSAMWHGGQPYVDLTSKGQTNSILGYITLGMLKRCKEQSYTLRIIDGGEGFLGYLQPSAQYMAQKIRNCYIKSKGFLAEYPNLELGGVSAPFMASP